VNKGFKSRALAVILVFTTVFILYNQNNSSKAPPEFEQIQSKKVDEDLIAAINLLDQQVSFLKEEIEDIKKGLESKDFINYGDNQILPETSTNNSNFNSYGSIEMVSPFRTKVMGSQDQTYNESQQEALELLQNTDIFENIQEAEQ
tara:strand:- start:70 stop:507 length:438 start_codon:yes stop_codon:yes gene_type:complete